MQKHLADRLFLEFNYLLRREKLEKISHISTETFGTHKWSTNSGEGLHYIHVEDGWLNLLKSALTSLESYLEENNFVSDLFFTRIEAKYGHMILQTNFSNPFIDGVISSTRILSSMTCEICGSPGYLVGPSVGFAAWTLCEKHANRWGYLPAYEIDYEIDVI